MRAFCFLFLRLWLSLAILPFTISADIPIAKPGCRSSCGNLTIPYPFGIITENEGCYRSRYYTITCDTSFNPPKSFLAWGSRQVIDINITGQMRITNSVGSNYYQDGKVVTSSYGRTSLNEFPYIISDTANKLTLIGCDDYAYIYGTWGRTFRTGCMAGCSRPEDVISGSCSGIGCCQTSIPKGLKNFYAQAYSWSNHTNISYFNPYSYAFLAEEDKFTFNITDLSDPTFKNRTIEDVPIMLEWFIMDIRTCGEAMGNLTTYACQNNTKCTDFDGAPGYRCSCHTGYEGNPYLSPGCTDIDECADPSNACSHICTNIPGSHKCSCPKGYKGDGLKTGSRCSSISDRSQFVTRLILGVSLGLLFVVVPIIWLCSTMIKRQKNMRIREIFFEQNGGLLFKQQISQYGGTMESSKIFSADELKAATNNYHEDRILGKGGHGTVYKGILGHGREVAIKKSTVSDQNQIEQFINEVVILTQINHRNVVKLLGCCLETEVPLLVYEYISSGTLFEHIHENKGITSWLTWANCIRLASEAADALMYLHSAASIPIVHRDVKTTNILLDNNYTAKISDFGASRLVPIDQTQVTTLVQGTLGYLDPEYFHTSQLTTKSDVYSFGVVLAELLTKEKPLCSERKITERNLATYFILAIKEGRLMEILDPQLVREASEEQLVQMANLIKECLNVKGEDRPSMKEVALILEALKKQNRHPSGEQNTEETTDSSLMGQHRDLYPVALNDQNGNATSMELSGQYSMEISLMADMNHPR